MPKRRLNRRIRNRATRQEHDDVTRREARARKDAEFKMAMIGDLVGCGVFRRDGTGDLVGTTPEFDKEFLARLAQVVGARTVLRNAREKLGAVGVDVLDVIPAELADAVRWKDRTVADARRGGANIAEEDILGAVCLALGRFWTDGMRRSPLAQNYVRLLIVSYETRMPEFLDIVEEWEANESDDGFEANPFGVTSPGRREGS